MIRFDLVKLEELIINVHKLCNVKVSVFNDKFEEILFYPLKYNKFCRLVRTTEEGTNICLQADNERLLECKRTKKAKTYICPMGLTEIFNPIIVHGNVVGYLSLGQIISDNTDINLMIKNALKLGISKDSIDNAINEVNKIPHSLIKASALILDACAKFVYVDNYVGYLNNDLLENIIEFIENNLHLKLTVELLCKKFYLSRVKIYNIFQNNFNLTVADYIKNRRIEKAKELLKDSSYSVSEVAFKVGQEYNYFSKVFYKEVGVTPKKYQKQNS